MRLILSDGIGRYQSLLPHDAPNATSGYDEALLQELDFDLSGAVGFAILVKNRYNRCREFFWFGGFFRFIVEGASGDLQDVAHC